MVATKRDLKKHKKNPGVINLLTGDVASDVTEWISTGFANLDRILGGGWAIGRSSEVIGPEGSGKSALVHMAIRSAQLMGGFVYLYDFERALDKAKVLQLKIDPQRLIYCKPRTIEDALGILQDHFTKLEQNPPGVPVLFAWDSIAASMSKDEADRDADENLVVGAQARAMGRVFRALTGRVPDIRAHLMFVNQERDAIGKPSMFAEPVTPGGRAAKYFTSQRVRCTRVATLKEPPSGGEAVGYLIQALTKKSRLFPPHRKAKWVIDFIYGPSPELTAFHTLLDARVIKSAGKGQYTAPFCKLFNRNQWMDRMADKDFKAGVMEQVLSVVGQGANQAGPLPDEEGEDEED